MLTFRSECIPTPTGPCVVEPVDPATLTVEGLFAEVRKIKGERKGATVTIVYDPKYGYPRDGSRYDPKVRDDERGWEVESFTPAK